MQHLPSITPFETGPSTKTSASKSESSIKTTNVQMFTSKPQSLTFLRKWNKSVKQLTVFKFRGFSFSFFAVNCFIFNFTGFDWLKERGYRPSFRHNFRPAEKAETTTCFSICEHRSPLAREILLCEQRRTDHRGYQKQLNFSISLEFSLVEKCHAHFLKKISQLKSDIRSCRCKNFSLKVVSVRSDRAGPDPPDPSPGSVTAKLEENMALQIF